MPCKVLYDQIPGHYFKLIYVKQALFLVTLHSTKPSWKLYFYFCGVFLNCLSPLLGKDLSSFILRSIPTMLPGTIILVNELIHSHCMNPSMETGLESTGIRLIAARDHQCARWASIDAFFVYEVRSGHSFWTQRTKNIILIQRYNSTYFQLRVIL